MKTEQEIKSKKLATSILEDSKMPSEQRLLISQTITGLLGLLELSRFDLFSLWQPIQTAPKDETFILLGNPEWEICWQGFWDVNGWQRFNSSGQDYLNPTHWMPLPGLPKK